jgi:hypothetical protein
MNLIIGAKRPGRADYSLADTIIHCDSIDAVNADEVWRKLDAMSVVTLRGLVDPALVRRHLQRIKDQYSPANDCKRGPGEYHLIKSNYQRLCLGSPVARRDIPTRGSSGSITTRCPRPTCSACTRPSAAWCCCATG